MGDRFDILRELIIANKCKQLLEVGVFRCERSHLMIKAALEHAKPEEIFFTGLDMFEDMTAELTKKEVSRPSGPWSELMCKEYLRMNFPGVRTQLIKGDTKETLKNFRLSEYDFVFLDGGHSIQTAMSDWLNISLMMKPGTIVCFDDYSEKSTMINTKAVVDTIDRNIFSVEIAEQCDFASSDYEDADLRIAIVRMK